MDDSRFLHLLQALSERIPVQPSTVLDDTHEAEIDGTLVYLQWNGASGCVELTLPLPPEALPDGGDTTAALLAVCRRLLQRQWAMAGTPHRPGFGMLPDRDETVGMAAIELARIADADALLDALRSCLVGVLTAWFEVCAEVIAEQAMKARTPAPAAGLSPAALQHA